MNVGNTPTVFSSIQQNSSRDAKGNVNKINNEKEERKPKQQQNVIKELLEICGLLYVCACVSVNVIGHSKKKQDGKPNRRACENERERSEVRPITAFKCNRLCECTLHHIFICFI